MRLAPQLLSTDRGMQQAWWIRNSREIRATAIRYRQVVGMGAMGEEIRYGESAGMVGGVPYRYIFRCKMR